jgi:hypothetical protein
MLNVSLEQFELELGLIVITGIGVVIVVVGVIVLQLFSNIDLIVGVLRTYGFFFFSAGNSSLSLSVDFLLSSIG